ncbi:MAG: cytochrome b [Betaproteobacteria bacterium RIFCSPLOWO2_12_FULL_62_58]|nr:MAG: cytochrome b [Betaproteobacteria bacterium RIFCSPLOWO2_12_FULL_62_58]
MSTTVPARYTKTAIALHWLIFVLIACGFTLAVYMVDLPLSPQKLKYFSWHKWIGVTVFLAALIRVGWRLTHPAPSLPVAMPQWEQHAVVAAHAALYVLIVIIPITGWLYSSATGVPTVYLGLMQLPDLVPKDKPLAEQLKFAHISLNYTLFVIACIHAAAALRHHFVDRDEVLSRMVPAIRPRGKE